MELFVSDLDGTLLNKNSEISQQSREILNQLIEQGINFTIATARTHATVLDLLEGLNIKMPIAIMNGVGIYDVEQRKYIEIVDVKREVTKSVLNVFDEFGLEPMVYGIKNQELYVFYRKLTNAAAQHFYDIRSNRPLKKFIKIDEFTNVINETDIINMLVFDEYEKIKAAAEKIQAIEGITVTYYSTHFDNLGYMELYSSNASKANGIKALSKYCDFNELVVFGDNLNDVPMFELADEAYAPNNAVDAIKQIATGVIGHHDADAVANYIYSRVTTNNKKEK